MNARMPLALIAAAAALALPAAASAAATPAASGASAAAKPAVKLLTLQRIGPGRFQLRVHVARGATAPRISLRKPDGRVAVADAVVSRHGDLIVIRCPHVPGAYVIHATVRTSSGRAAHDDASIRITG